MSSVDGDDATFAFVVVVAALVGLTADFGALSVDAAHPLMTARSAMAKGNAWRACFIVRIVLIPMESCIMRTDHSKRSAARGLRRAALRAGKTPKMTPTTTDTPNAMGIAIPGMMNGT